MMLLEAGMAAVKANQSNSFAVDLGKWLSIMEAYEKVIMRMMPPYQLMRSWPSTIRSLKRKPKSLKNLQPHNGGKAITFV